MRKLVKRLYWFLHFLIGDFPYKQTNGVIKSIKIAWRVSGFVNKGGWNI